MTRRYDSVVRSREIGLRETPRSFRGFRPSMAVSALYHVTISRGMVATLGVPARIRPAPAVLTL